MEVVVEVTNAVAVRVAMVAVVCVGARIVVAATFDVMIVTV